MQAVTPMALGATVAGYVLLGLLLLSLNVASSWRWWIKAGAIVLTTAFFAGSYFAINGMLGWPTAEAMPKRFMLVWTRIVEPDRHSNEQGAIYLWAEELDVNNVPSGRPRAYQLPYTRGMARGMEKIQERIEQGEEIQGSVESQEKSRVRDEDMTPIEDGTVAENLDNAARVVETVPFMDEHLEFHFETLPAIILPDKPVNF